MVTRDDVLLAYRFLQQREPESEEVIGQWMNEAKSIDDMIAAVIVSDEFRHRMGGRVAVGNFSLPETSPPLEIDIRVTPAQLSELFERIKHQWEEIGSSEAHWSVLTDDRYSPDKIDENLDAFYATGGKEVATLHAYLKRNQIDAGAIRSCFELGCGVGRITEHLAQSFPAVTAADISAEHLTHASARLKERGNVSLKLLREITDLTQISGYDLFYSIIVFQHNPPPVIDWMLRTVLGNLNPGGVGLFQIPSYYANYTFSADHYLRHDPKKIQAEAIEAGEIPSERHTMDAHPLPQRDVFAICRETHCDVLEVREDDWVGKQRHTLSNTYLVRKR